LQASDRRFTVLNAAGDAVDFSDGKNKAIFVGDRHAFTYTGIANIDGDTARFVQLQMARLIGSGASVDSAGRETAQMLADQLNALPSEIDRRFALVSIGWGTAADPFNRSPHVRYWSNALNQDGSWRAVAERSLAESVIELPAFGDPFALVAAGVELDSSFLQSVHAQIAYQLTQSDHPAKIGLILIGVLRTIAAAYPDGPIGSGVMMNCIPRALGAPNGQIGIWALPPRLDARTFTYIPEDDNAAPEYLAPLTVGPDGSALGEAGGRGVSWVPGQIQTFSFGYSDPGVPPKVANVGLGQRINLLDIGRNHRCWCDSGKKYKNCHGPIGLIDLNDPEAA
jgi:hypothetical protein